MKKLFLLSTTLFAFSCSNSPEKDVIETATEVVNIHDSADKTREATILAPSQEGIEASYVGDFEAVDVTSEKSYYYKNKINITIDSIKSDNVYGHSVVAGNQRPFTGSSELKNGIYTISATEPGDNKYDGKFDFKLNASELTIEGTWKANNPKLEVNERIYKLFKRFFTYNTSNVLPENVTGMLISEWSVISRFEDATEMITADAVKYNASVDKLKKEDGQ